MKRALWAASMTLAMFLTTTGCQRGRRPPPDMSEWEIAEQPRTVVTTSEPRVREPERTTVVARPTDRPTDDGVIAHSSLNSLIGRRCRVQFRRDALGMAVGAPLSPTSEGVGGRPAHLDGTITAVSESWITLARGDATYNIPHAAILLIESHE